MHRYVNVYKRRWHVFVTLLIVAIPFASFLLFVPSSILQKQVFLESMVSSGARLLIAYLISVILIIPLALLAHGALSKWFLPLFDVMQSFPSFAMLPLVVKVLGASDATVIFFLVVTMMWPMLFSVISAQKLIRQDWEEAATIFGATTKWKRFKNFTLPISYPGIVTGSIVGLGEGWEAVVGAEIIAGLNQSGLGQFFSGNSQSTSTVLFGVMGLLLFIFAINKILWLPLLESSHKTLAE